MFITGRRMVVHCFDSFMDIMISSPDDTKTMRKRASHNETEKRRIKNISKAIDDMRVILDVFNNLFV